MIITAQATTILTPTGLFRHAISVWPTKWPLSGGPSAVRPLLRLVRRPSYSSWQHSQAA
jgi:hypothetical protein